MGKSNIITVLVAVMVVLKVRPTDAILVLKKKKLKFVEQSYRWKYSMYLIFPEFFML